MSTPVFLTLFDPAGAQRYFPLNRHSTTPTFYLPDIIVPDINVSTKRDSQHFNITLDVEQDYCLLSVYSDEIQPVIILGDLEIEAPISTSTHQKSFILTEEHQFVTPISRWQVQWDRSGVISHSMRPPAKSSSELQSDEEHVRQLELLPSMDGNALVDRQELNNIVVDNESGQMRIWIEDIHLSPERSTTSTEGEVPESGTRTNLEGLKTISHSSSSGQDGNQPANVSHVDAVQSEYNSADMPSLHHLPSRSERRATFLAIFDDEEDQIDAKDAAEDGLSANGSEVPESPNYPLGKETISDEAQRTSTIVAVPNRRILTEALVNDLNKASETQDNVRLQAFTRKNESSMSTEHHHDTEMDVEHSGKEDDSQLQKDRRTSKRRMSEIEDEKSSVRRKMAKVNNEQLGRTTLENPGGSGKHEPAFKTVIHTAQASVGADTSLTSTVKPSEGKIRIPLPHKKSEKSQTSNIPAHYSAIVKTPRRRSLRKSETPASSSSAPQGGPKHGRLKVVFSSASEIPKKKNVLQAIEKLGGTVIDSIDDADVLCIGPGALKKTSKLIIAIARGVAIVTDDWVRQAQNDQTFPPCKDFLPRDPNSEKEWSFSLSHALKRGRCAVNFLDGVHVYLTTQVRKDLGNLAKDLKQVALALGAVQVHAGLPSKKSREQVLVIGSTKNVDPEGAKVNRLGHKLYVQDLLTMGVLRGKLDIESNEFVIDVPVKDEPTSSQ